MFYNKNILPYNVRVIKHFYNLEAC